jgi:hypothetical protein
VVVLSLKGIGPGQKVLGKGKVEGIARKPPQAHTAAKLYRMSGTISKTGSDPDRSNT